MFWFDIVLEFYLMSLISFYHFPGPRNRKTWNVLISYINILFQKFILCSSQHLLMKTTKSWVHQLLLENAIIIFILFSPNISNHPCLDFLLLSLTRSKAISKETRKNVVIPSKIHLSNLPFLLLNPIR